MFYLLFSLLISVAHAKFVPLDPDLKSYLYPFLVETFPVQVKDQRYQMAYMDIKPEGKIKDVVILLHGKNFSGNYWEKTARDLIKLNYRVIIPDQIGFGKSSKPENFPYTFQLLGTFTHNLVSSLGIKAYTVVGHSMGGMLATRMALMYPKEIKKLILVNPIGLEDWKTMVSYKTVSELFQEELQKNEGKIRTYQQNSYFDGKWNEEYEKGIDIAVGWTLHGDYPIVAWNNALTADMIFTQPVVYEFKNLKQPTFLLLGTRDRTALGKGWADEKTKKNMGRYDLLGKKVVKMIPKGQLVELPGIGHMPQVESYDSYWQNLKKFLQK